MVKITYKDISLTAKGNSTLVCEDKHDFVNLEQLKEENVSFKKFATLEKNFWKLDGTFESFPDEPTKEKFGLWSKSMSDENGNFENKPTLEITFSGYQTSVGLTLQFNPDTNDYCNSLNIKWYQDNTLLSVQDFEPNNAKYFCQNNISNFNKIEITFNSTNNPYRYLKVQTIEYGVIRIFTEDDLRNASILEEISLISEEISINTFNFTLDNKEDIDFIFQKKQPLTVEYNSELVGTFFISNPKRKSKSVYEVEATDYIGLLDKDYFSGGTYVSVLVSDLISEIMGAIPYELEDTLAMKTLSGTLERCTRREALLQVVFAACGVVNTARSDKVNIYSLSEESVNTINEDSIYTGCSFESEDEVTEIRLELNDGTVVSKRSSVITDDTPENVLEFTGVFVDSSNCDEILNNLYNYFITNKNNKTNMKFKFSNEKTGDVIDYVTEYLGAKKGQIISMKYNLNSRKLVADAVIKELEVE